MPRNANVSVLIRKARCGAMWAVNHVATEEEHLALVVEPESQTIKQLNRSVDVLREMLYQKQLDLQTAKERHDR